MRASMINKILFFQYRLGEVVGRKEASRIYTILERSFTTTLEGREVYHD